MPFSVLMTSFSLIGAINCSLCPIFNCVPSLKAAISTWFRLVPFVPISPP
ncbi:hypothetical protein Lalb_Chr06g0170791 [Lupinus albus]|uniref:Uncharacterized protein n=1 Tax=Lupinus albus TaxID=3870 RepID=A0A6A4QFJ6_LUPAL|nr:hypothetical protein Lalb_Chr06g0170791 [Lupinus albus]